MRVLLFVLHDSTDAMIQAAREFIQTRFPDMTFNYVYSWDMENNITFNYAVEDNWVRVSDTAPRYEPWAAMYYANEVYALVGDDIIIMKNDYIPQKELKDILSERFLTQRILTTSYSTITDKDELRASKYSFDRVCLRSNIQDNEVEGN